MKPLMTMIQARILSPSPTYQMKMMTIHRILTAAKVLRTPAHMTEIILILMIEDPGSRDLDLSRVKAIIRTMVPRDMLLIVIGYRSHYSLISSVGCRPYLLTFE